MVTTVSPYTLVMVVVGWWCGYALTSVLVLGGVSVRVIRREHVVGVVPAEIKYRPVRRSILFHIL